MRSPEGRGGYRAPRGGPRVSGVGAASQRSDAAQPVRVPNIGDAEDLTHGERQKLEAAQRQIPLGRALSPRLSAVAPPSSSLPMGGAAASGELGEHIFALPSTRPGEPETEGLPFGPGAGPEVLQANQVPDDKTLLLDFLRRGGNEDARRVLMGMIEAQRPPDIPSIPTAGSPLSVEEEPPLDPMAEVGFDEEVDAELMANEETPIEESPDVELEGEPA